MCAGISPRPLHVELYVGLRRQPIFNKILEIFFPDGGLEYPSNMSQARLSWFAVEIEMNKIHVADRKQGKRKEREKRNDKILDDFSP